VDTQNIYSMYDTEAEEYSAPNLAVNDKVAARSFIQFIQAKKIPPSVVQALEVHRIGVMNMSNGSIQGMPPVKIELVYSPIEDLTEVGNERR